MKMKKFIAGIMAVCVMGFCVLYVNTLMENNSVITASAEEETDYTEGIYESFMYKNYGDYIEISDCDYDVTEVVIPSEIDGIPVTSIGNSAFSGRRRLTSVIIPDSVSIIGICAFENCTGLTSINIPNSVTSIGGFAFLNCKNLISVNIPESVEYIGKTAFSYTLWIEEKREENPLVIINNILIDAEACTGDVFIPDNVTDIADDALNLCKDLTSINVSVGNMNYSSENGVLYNKDKTTLVFYPCGKTETEFIIPDSVVNIGELAFFNCNNLTSVKISDSVISIGEGAFYYCINLTSVEIPNSVTSIGDKVFACCNSLTSIEIPDSVTNIEYGAFSCCSSLTSIKIPDSVTSIGEWAFESCKGLTSIEILNPDCSIFDFNDTISETATIYGYENSTAQAYAEKYNRNFVSFGKAPEKETATGDMNGDGDVNIADAVFLQKYILGGQEITEEQFKNADLTGDGYVDSFDMVLLRKQIINK